MWLWECLWFISTFSFVKSMWQENKEWIRQVFHNLPGVKHRYLAFCLFAYWLVLKRIVTTMSRNKLWALLVRMYSTNFFREIKSLICVDLEIWLKGRVLRLLIFECPSQPRPFTNVIPFLTDGATEDWVLSNQPKVVQLIIGKHNMSTYVCLKGYVLGFIIILLSSSVILHFTFKVI